VADVLWVAGCVLWSRCVQMGWVTHLTFTTCQPDTLFEASSQFIHLVRMQLTKDHPRKLRSSTFVCALQSPRYRNDIVAHELWSHLTNKSTINYIYIYIYIYTILRRAAFEINLVTSDLYDMPAGHVVPTATFEINLLNSGVHVAGLFRL
jgi:hypothetical protein